VIVPLVVFAVPRVVYNQQVVGSVVILYECADMAVYLVLRLAGDIELHDLGDIVEAVVEESLEFFAL
jgi:hypothetical protein